MNTYTMTADEQQLVEQNLHLIHWTIREYFLSQMRQYSLEYEDLYQEGAIALCRAAMTYQTGQTQFSTYAITVIRNHLTDTCRHAHNSKRPLSLDAQTETGQTFTETIADADDTEGLLDELSVQQLFAHGKQVYHGVARLGMEALELKYKGYSGADIARLYHTKPNHVGAWISRAKAKLKKDSAVREIFSDFVEKRSVRS